MNSVIGITNLLLRSKLDDQQTKYVSMIQAASEQLMSIINDILDISKIEAGKMQFESIAFSPEQVIGNVRNILSMKAEEKKLDLKIKIDPTLPAHVTGDPSRLAQVLINLVGNAIKFTETGFVEISAKPLSLNSTTCLVEFSVSDTGIGIAADKLSAIFESFTQANSDTSRKYGGTGLGLSISRQLVELQDGKIGLESKPGVGTRFYFQIPYAVANHSHQTEVASDSGHVSDGLKGINILLVEDNDFNKIVAEDTLQEYIGDIKIDHAYNGVIAVEKVRDNTYDLVLMDIQMPEMDGYEATGLIRQMEGSKGNIPIIAMTANATPEEIKKCFESGVNAYVSKPFVPEDLLSEMTRVIKGRKIT
jgi:CheY-like chemotaxis protein